MRTQCAKKVLRGPGSQVWLVEKASLPCAAERQLIQLVAALAHVASELHQSLGGVWRLHVVNKRHFKIMAE
jgi:hypothetical protein